MSLPRLFTTAATNVKISQLQTVMQVVKPVFPLLAVRFGFVGVPISSSSSASVLLPASYDTTITSRP